VETDPRLLVLAPCDVVLLATACACVDNRETPRKSALLQSSLVLLAKPRGSLDIEGGALTQNLGNLYEYMTRCLMRANLNSDSGSRRSAGVARRDSGLPGRHWFAK
jgi:flagellar biosynthetic protein FliS